ncbi:MAG TPA: APC family permease [Bryobacteraceae bacterium]|nr:APC family permease [Bryobacteraceae bacterium]
MKQREIAHTREQSASLRKELRLVDLVFLQVLLIVGLPWVGYAAMLGGSHVVVWLAAIALFYLPLAGTVIFLSRRIPLEGGVYQWARLGLSPFAGFQAAWNYSFFLILFYAASGSLVANSVSYLLGPGAAWMTANKPLILALNASFFAVVYVVNVRGLHLARWVTSAGGILVIALYLLIVGLLARGEPMAQPPLALAWPAFSLLTVNLFSKMAFNALSGFEQVAIFAGECHTPERNIARSVWIAAPGIALLYILGTCALLAYTDRAHIDLIAPIAQILGASLGASRLTAALNGTAILALLFAYFTQTVACVAQVSRLPMVAGWDGLLPSWFSALHPRFRTPVRSLGVVVAACLIFGAASLVQVGEQEAAQILIAAGMACSGLYYLTMFAVVLWGRWESEEHAPWWLRVAACSAAGVTVLSVGMQVVPILDVARPWLFALKVGGAVAAINLAGAWVYRQRR